MVKNLKAIVVKAGKNVFLHHIKEVENRLYIVIGDLGLVSAYQAHNMASVP